MASAPQSQKNRSPAAKKVMSKMMNAKVSDTPPNATSKTLQKKVMSQSKYKKGM